LIKTRIIKNNELTGGRWRIQFPMVSLEIFLAVILPAALPRGRLSL